MGASGKISYALYYRNADGQQRKYTIGHATHWTPKRARDEARRLLVDISEVRDPSGAKQNDKLEAAQVKGRTLNVVLEGDFWDYYLSTRRSGKATQARIERAWRPFGDQDLSTITV